MARARDRLATFTTSSRSPPRKGPKRRFAPTRERPSLLPERYHRRAKPKGSIDGGQRESHDQWNHRRRYRRCRRRSGTSGGQHTRGGIYRNCTAQQTYHHGLGRANAHDDLTCRTAKHGFFLSRERQHIW